MLSITLPQLIAQAQTFVAQSDFHHAATLINVGLILYPRNPALIEIYQTLPIQYDGDFFEDTYHKSYLSAKLYLSFLQTHCAFDSMVDIGAGMGAWSHAAIELNKKILSVDGHWVRDIPKKHTHLNYHYVDLNESIIFNEQFDLAICVEVAEHLNPARSVGFVNDICRLAPMILFGAALPRQGGAGHINCRPHSFWIDLFSKNAFTAIDLFRPAFWYDGRVEPWYAQNTYLFVSEMIAHRFSNFAKPSIVNIYHPHIVIDSPICLHDHKNGIIDPGCSGL